MISAGDLLRHPITFIFMLAACCTGYFLSGNTVVAQSPSEAEVEALQSGRPPKSFMRKKLASTQKVMEGLTTENRRLIVEGADELLKVTDDASWKVPRDAYFIHYSNDFKRTLRDLRNSAERGNIEEATFAYTHATFSCMACHRHVRGVVPLSTN